MIEKLLFNFEFLLVDFLTAYGFTTILLLILSIFTKKLFLKEVDDQSNRFIALIGIVYIIVWIAATFAEFNSSDEESRTYLLRIMFGAYWFGFWLQPLLWFSITQLLRLEKIRRNILLRLIFSFLLILSIERMVIILTSFHRDYLPSSWTMHSSGIYPSNIFLELVMKVSIFLLFVGIFTMISRKVKKLNQSRIQ